MLNAWQSGNSGTGLLRSWSAGMGWSSQAALVHMPAHMMKLLFPWLSETLEARDDSNNRFPFACWWSSCYLCTWHSQQTHSPWQRLPHDCNIASDIIFDTVSQPMIAMMRASWICVTLTRPQQPITLPWALIQSSFHWAITLSIQTTHKAKLWCVIA